MAHWVEVRIAEASKGFPEEVSAGAAAERLPRLYSFHHPKGS
jgi:hypothetical protein